jgi:hypothetical protein
MPGSRFPDPQRALARRQAGPLRPHSAFLQVMINPQAGAISPRRPARQA